MIHAVTFGQKYQDEDEQHPVVPGVTEKSFLIIDAHEKDEARKVARDALNNDYAILYPIDEDWLRQMEQFDLLGLPWRIAPCSCHDGCNWAWMYKRKGNTWQTIGGCAFHTDLYAKLVQLKGENV
jgi:hypothetical protein